MSDTKRIALLIFLVLWAIFSLAVSTRAEEFTSPKCGDELALNIPVHKKLGTSHRVTGDYGGFGGSVPVAAGCASCNSSNDGYVYEDPDLSYINGSVNVSVGSWRASQVTTTAAYCVTGVYINVKDGGGNTGATGELYTDNSNQPGSIYNAAMTATVANLPDGNSNVEFLFSEAIALPAGTYWVVMKPVTGTVYINGYDDEDDASGRNMAWEDPNWSDVVIYHHYYIAGVLGCE